MLNSYKNDFLRKQHFVYCHGEWSVKLLYFLVKFLEDDGYFSSLTSDNKSYNTDRVHVPIPTSTSRYLPLYRNSLKIKLCRVEKYHNQLLAAGVVVSPITKSVKNIF
jgi:hypothetical protein